MRNGRKKSNVALLKKEKRETHSRKESARITLKINYNFLHLIPDFYKLFNIINPRPSNGMGI